MPETNPGTTGLLSWWSMDESSSGVGAVTREDSHGSNDLTDVNTTPSATGRVGNCSNHNPNNVEHFSRAHSGWTFASNEASLSFWVKLNAATPPIAGWSGIVDFGTGTASLYPFVDGLIYMDAFRTARVDGITPSGAVTRTNWHLVTITTTPGANGWQMYQNTTLIKQATGQSSVTVPSTILVGASDGTFRINGMMDEVNVWNRVLTADEIAWLYNSGNGRAYSELAVPGGKGLVVLQHWHETMMAP